MLEIIAKNTKLDLPTDIQIALVIENPLLKENRIPTPYSLSFELPATQTNLQLFGWPDRVTAYKSKDNIVTVPCEIRFSSISISRGHLKLMSYMKSLKVSFSGIDHVADAKKKLYEIDFGKEYFFDGTHDTPINFLSGDNWARSYRRWAESALNNTREDFILAPIGIYKNAIPSSRTERIDSYSRDSTPSVSSYERFRSIYRFQDNCYFNLYNPYRENFLITPDHPDYDFTIAVSHANAYPQFRVGYIFKKIFGEALGNNPFLNAELRDLVMPTFYYPTWDIRIHSQAAPSQGYTNAHFPPMVANPRPNYDQPYPDVPYLDYKEYLPDVAANEFLKTILTTFCYSLFSIKGKLIFKNNSDILRADPDDNWSSKLSDQQDISLESAKSYVYGYKESKPFTSSEEFSTVPNVTAMSGVPYELNSEKYYEARFYISETKQRFLKKVIEREVNIPIANYKLNKQDAFYELLDDAAEVKVDRSGDIYEIESDVQLLPNFPLNAFWSTENDRDLYINTYSFEAPCIDIDDRAKRPDNISLLFYKGFRPIRNDPTKTFPYLSIYPSADRPENLLWEGPHGLIETYHKDFKGWVEREKVRISAPTQLNVLDLHNLDISKKKHINGRNFFIDKIQITVRHNQIDLAQVDYIEA